MIRKSSRLECDEDKERFEQMLGKIAHAKAGGAKKSPARELAKRGSKSK